MSGNRTSDSGAGSGAPVDREPARGLVVYDGACAFCRASVARIRKLDRKCHFEYVPRETAGLEEAYPQLDLTDLDSGLRLLDARNQVDVGADAIYQILLKLPPYRLVAWMYSLPLIRGLSRRAYAWVAAHRRELASPCAPGLACRLPEDETSLKAEAGPRGDGSPFRF